MTPKIRLELDATEVKAFIKPKPKEIARANRLVMNKLVGSITRDSSVIAKKSRVRVIGFKKARVIKTKAIARHKRPRAKVWVGGNRILASYLGKPRQLKKGARAGSHFFSKAFVATMKSGYTSVFKQLVSGKIQEESVPVVELKPELQIILNKHKSAAGTMLKSELEKILKRRVSRG